jgi:hypothetical protein
MASRKPLVLNGGQIEQLQSGDTLNASCNEVDSVIKTNDNAGAIVIGQPVYVKSNGNVDLARANAQGTVQVLGLVTNASVAAAGAANIQTDGVLTATTGEWDAVTGETGGLTPGAVYYLDDATAGMMTQTAPSAAGKFVVRVGVALSTTELDIDNTPPIKL